MCIRDRKQAENPHILSLSPPLNLSPKWLGGHTGYTLAKYGMTMATLGMAAEFAEAGIAANALWPETTVATAAVQFSLGGDKMMRVSRTPEAVSYTHLDVYKRQTVQRIERALDEARRRVHEVAAATQRGAGCTLAGAIRIEHQGVPHWYVLNVCDSRVYLQRGNSLRLSLRHI